MAENQVTWFDFTIFIENLKVCYAGNAQDILRDKIKYLEESKDELITDLKMYNASKWAFQLEQSPTTNKLHFQGRFVLYKKIRLSTLIKKIKKDTNLLFLNHAHLSATSSNSHNFDYVKKSESRVLGPWTCHELEQIIPRDIKDLKFYPWQSQLVKLCETYEPRKIIFIFDETGCSGKSTIGKWLAFFKGACLCPAMNNYKDIVQAASSFKRTNDKCNTFIFDIPRALGSDKHHSMFAAVESIKSGVICDTRYKFDQQIIEPPNVVVYSNFIPEPKLLSADRWQFFKIMKLISVNDLPSEDLPPSDGPHLVPFYPNGYEKFNN